MNYEELVKSGKNIGDMTKEELFEYCYGLLGEVWNFEKEIDRLNNIINELEKWLKFFNENGIVIDLEKGKETTIIPTLAVLDKLKELKEDSK